MIAMLENWGAITLIWFLGVSLIRLPYIRPLRPGKGIKCEKD